MPNASGIIFIDTSTTPHKGVSIADVQQVLGRGTGDLGLLCSDQEWYENNGTLALRRVYIINPCAKFKPVCLTVLGTDEQLEEDAVNHRMVWKSTADWWKGEGIHPTCGFVVPSYASIGELIETNDVWQYLCPRGLNGGGQGVHEWFRLKDFNQYNHNAVCPINVHLPDDTTVTTTVARNIGVSLVLKADAVLPDYNLKLTDIGDYGSMYLGLVVVKGQQAYIKTNSQAVGTGYGGNLIALDGCPLISSAGTVMLYAVLVGSVESSWTNVYEGAVISLNVEEGAGVCELTIVEPQQNAYRIVLNGLTNADKRQWTRRGVIACVLAGGSLVGSDVQIDDMANDYNLVSVDWKVVKHSAQSVIVSQGTLSSLNNVEPDTLQGRIDAPDPDYNDGQLVNFNAPYEVGTLPSLADDYYIITYNFNYQTLL